MNRFERAHACRSFELSSIKKIMNTMPQYSTLGETVEIHDEVTLRTLKPCDTIRVRTCNSDYEIFLFEPQSGRALVVGGKHFAEPMEATVSGSTFGGSMLKMGWLGVGLRMELNINGRCIVTSPIQELHVKHQSLIRNYSNSCEDSTQAIEEAHAI
jgi:hypothetical protein